MEILINNIPLEVSGVPVQIDLSNTMFDDDSTIKAYKTNKLDIPATPYNTAILTWLQELNSGGYTAGIGTIRGNGVDFTGRVKLYPATTVRGRSVMPIQIVSGNGDWVKELEGEMLNETDLSSLSHTFDRATILASETGTSNYLYDLCDRGENIVPGEWQLVERFPAIRKTFLLTKIFNEKGIRVLSNTLSDGYINKLFYIFCQPDSLRERETWNQENFKASGLPTPYSAFATIGTSQYGGLTWYTPSPGVETQSYWATNFQTIEANDGDHYTKASGVYTVDDNQAVSTKLMGSLRCKIERANNTSQFYLYVSLSIRKGSIFGDVVATSAERFNPSPTSYFDYYVETDWFRPEVGDVYYLTLKYRGVLSNNTQLKAVIDTTTANRNYFKNYTKNWYATGETVDFADILPDNISKLDYIKSMAKDFDLLFDYHPDTRTIRIENRSKYFTDVYRNFEGIIDTDEAITVDHVVEDVGVAIHLSTMKDSGDLTPGYLKTTTPYVLDTRNQYGYKPDVSKRTVSWSDTMLMRQTRLGFGSIPIPTLWKDGAPVIEDGVQKFSKFSTEFEQRVLYYSGRKTVATGYTFDGTRVYTYPQMERVLASDIADRYWPDYLWQLRNAKRLRVSAYIPGIVVNRLINSLPGASLRTPVAVSIQGLAHGIFMIEKIEGYSLDKPGICDVQLIELPPVARDINTGTTPILEITLINGGQLNVNDGGDSLSLSVPADIPLEIEEPT